MFEGLLEKFLASFLGDYIENLDPAKLSVSIWSGNIELHDLRLRSDLLTRLQLPFEVKLGIIKRLHLEFPWSRLASQPVVCKLEQLHLVVAPQPEAQWEMRDIVSVEHKLERLVAMLLEGLKRRGPRWPSSRPTARRRRSKRVTSRSILHASRTTCASRSPTSAFGSRKPRRASTRASGSP